MNRLKKGDDVIVIAGKDKGRRGVVKSFAKGGSLVLVEGINIVKNILSLTQIEVSKVELLRKSFLLMRLTLLSLTQLLKKQIEWVISLLMRKKFAILSLMASL